MLAGHSVHGAARGFHAARPRARSHPHRAAGGKARGSGQAGRQSGARAQQSRLRRAARRRQPASQPCAPTAATASSSESSSQRRADSSHRGMGREDPLPHGPVLDTHQEADAVAFIAPRGIDPRLAQRHRLHRGVGDRRATGRARRRPPPTSTSCAAFSATARPASRCSFSRAICAPRARPKPS